MSALQDILNSYRQAALSEREKGTYFEDLILCYLRNEASYRDLYAKVWRYAEWAAEHGLDKRDTGIDLVAQTQGTAEVHAIQCKLYAEDYRLQKGDIDSFFTASGKKPFTHRIIVSSTNHWSEHAEDALRGQQPPVSKIDLFDLENSQIEWANYAPKKPPRLKPRKTLRPHQTTAKDKVLAGLQGADRGKLIMACGTGKTFTSLKIAEALAGRGKRVLFLVPSLALLSQSLTEWTQESEAPLHSFAVCSDSDVGKKRTKDDDIVHTLMHELRYPATTEPKRLASEVAKRHDAQHMSVVFSTYHSIDVIARAQHQHGLPAFDLVICDEAHRTTGHKFEDEEESNFIRVHDGDYLLASKRLYMTATPRIYGELAKDTADKKNIALCSMDDVALYGEELHVITFSEAVSRGLLVDYKVIVLAVEEAHVSRRIQSLLKDENNQLKVDDAAKIIGCWKALAKQGLTESLPGDEAPMQRAVAFCQVIEVQKGAKTHKVSSKNIAGMFQAVVEAYQESAEDEAAVTLACEAEHVDGAMNASEKEQKLAWLKADPPADTCRILSNVRCLSEGVDVPALDAVLFLTPRNSQVDVVQSVGRVMRNAPGKRRGHVVLPVVIPAGMEAHEALNDNKTYKVVWQVLQALRSHDDRFDAMVNKLELNGPNVQKMEVVAITDKVTKKQRKTPGATNKDAGKGGFTIGEPAPKRFTKDDQANLPFEIGEIERAIYAKLVQKVGNRSHWEDWANDIAKIARTHIDRIRGILGLPTEKEGVGANVQPEEGNAAKTAFIAFAKELRDDLNDSISDGDIVEMLAQHLITKPVFDALFDQYSFASNNPMSRAMQAVLGALQEHRLDKEADTLHAFYDSVKMRAEGINNAAGKQKIVVELYDKFFRNAFPRMTERLGIVYTPVEVVDFIIHSVAHVLQTEFGQTLGSKGVHIIDPFTGTGTFITRLLQSGHIRPEQLAYKFKHEIHANEIVLLAYYIAAINIEAAYHDLAGGEYQPFEGICLTDTFQMHERDDLLGDLMEDNSSRRRKQKKLEIRVIVGNPPYSVGQKSANDKAQNIPYDGLRASLQASYIARSASNARSVYDTYVLAIKWATERLKSAGGGVVGFVSGSGFIDKPAMDGMRRCLQEDFCSLYILDLRGDIRKNMLSKGAAKEGGNVFASGSMTGIAISILVMKPRPENVGSIFYFDVGDDLSTEAKREMLGILRSISSLDGKWTRIEPNAHADWIKQRDGNLAGYLAIGDKQGREATVLFNNFSLGVATNRDAWCINSSAAKVEANMSKMIDFYDREVDRFQASASQNPDDVVTFDETKISWSYHLKKRLQGAKKSPFGRGNIKSMLYRPFTKQWLYYDKLFNEYTYQTSKLFGGGKQSDLAICVAGIGARSGFSTLIVDRLFSGDMVEKGQCFPLYLYEDAPKREQGRQSPQIGLLGDELPSGQERREAISDEGLAHFRAAYAVESISKEDIFFYVYGLLHSPEYRKRFADNLAKELPRIPCVKPAAAFWAFCSAGRGLAKLHLDYETVTMYAAKLDTGGKPLTDADYRVERMRFGKNGKEKDRTTIHYNARITVSGIPLEAYDYVVNGKSAIEWVMERQAVKPDKDSGIVNDANDWATETMGNARYPLELLLRVITVSLETMKIVRALPTLDI